jgi:hypothetical protein
VAETPSELSEATIRSEEIGNMGRVYAGRCWGLLALTIAVLVCLVACTGPTNDRLPQEWLGFYNGKQASGNYAIGIATTDDPLDGFTRDTTQSPILPPPGYTHIAAPCVVRTGNAYFMYVEGYATVSNTWRDLLLYTSSDGLHWTHHPRNPVLAGPSGARRCSVLYDPGDVGQEFKMWYVHSDTLDIWYAHSSDGVTWTQVGDGPALTKGAPGSWDSAQVIVGGAWKEAGTYYLFYAGFDGQDYQGGYASASRPDGPFHRGKENPIIRPRRLADQEIVGDLSSGETLVTASDSAVFAIGEPVVICNALGRWEVNRVASIPGANTIMLTSPTVQDYLHADHSHIRSWASQDVHSTYVWRSDGIWHVIACAFGCQKGIMQSVSFMVELTGYLSGASLSELSWVYAASPLLPMMNSLSLDWDQCSRENLSMVLRAQNAR